MEKSKIQISMIIQRDRMIGMLGYIHKYWNLSCFFLIRMFAFKDKFNKFFDLYTNIK